MKFSIKDFFSKCDQICNFLQIWSHLLKKSLMENFIFCAVKDVNWIRLFLVLYFTMKKERKNVFGIIFFCLLGNFCVNKQKGI